MKLKTALGLLLPSLLSNNSHAVVIADGFTLSNQPSINDAPGFNDPYDLVQDSDFWQIAPNAPSDLNTPFFKWGFIESEPNTFSDLQLFNTNQFQITQTTFQAQITANNTVPGLLVGNNDVFDSVSNFTIEDGDSSYFSIFFTLSESEGRHYGWIEIENNGGVLTSLGSAFTDGDGIIVGTTTVIPEPSTTLLCSLVSLSLLRRKRQS